MDFIKLEFVGANTKLGVPFAGESHAVNLNQSINDNALVWGFIRNQCLYSFPLPLILYVCEYHKRMEIHLLKMDDDKRWMLYRDGLLETADIKVDHLKTSV